MKSDTLGIVMITALLGGTTSAAQEPPDTLMFTAIQAAPLPPPPGIWEHPIGVMAVEPFEMAEPLQNAPYSAEVVTEVVQELADGNRIERRTTGAVARDRHGRTRREQQLAAIGPVLPAGDARFVIISDPVAGVQYSLDPLRKVAIRSRPSAPVHAAPAPAPVPAPPPIPPPDGTVPPDVVSFAHPGEPASEEVRTAKLGTREFEGVRAEGTRTTVTIPARSIGNERAIEIVSERWYSPELRVVVSSRRSDPRFGETRYNLTNIVREEPDPSRFQVPADYKIEEMRPWGAGVRRKLPPRPPM